MPTKPLQTHQTRRRTHAGMLASSPQTNLNLAQSSKIQKMMIMNTKTPNFQMIKTRHHLIAQRA